MKLSSFTTILIFIVLIIAGIALSPLLPVKLNPTSKYSSVSVSYSWNGADARNIEQEVTSVLEGAFSRIRGVKKISSVSSVNWGNIYIDFDLDTDPDAIRFEIAMIIRQIYPTLPNQVNYPQIWARRNENGSSQQILTYNLLAPSTPYLIQKYANDHIRPLLSSVKGIESIGIYGANPMEWIMEYDVNRFKAIGIGVSDVQTAISRYFSVNNAGLGYEVQEGDTSVIHLVFRSLKADHAKLLNIPVKKVAGRIVYLNDIVTIKHQEQEPGSFYRINGNNTINIVINAGASENQLKLSKVIKEKLCEVEKGFPVGYSLIMRYDATEFISRELMKNVWRAVYSVLILLLFVLIVTRSWRYLMLITFSLIANLAIAVIFYCVFKLEMHLYSLAGLTVSLSLIKNNSIVMIDHYRHQRNLKVFLAVLAATLTAIASLIVAFFLTDLLRQSLLDFSIIVIINLAVSLFVALFLIPALMDKMPLGNRKSVYKKQAFFLFRRRKLRSRFSIRFSRFYGRIIAFTCRFKWVFILLVVLSFGLPVYKLPEKIEKENLFARFYNKTLGGEWYKETMKPIIDVALGGALRVFEQYTVDHSYFGEVAKTTLYANAKMDFGSTLDQMDQLVKSIEGYLKQFIEIDQFHVNVNSGFASVVISFKKEHENSGFPFLLKEMLTQRAIEQGGADWNVYGVGEGFSNEVKFPLGNSRITLRGYNYEELCVLADSVRGKLMVTPRVKEVSVLSRDNWYKENAFEYVLEPNNEKLIALNVSPYSLYNILDDYSRGDKVIGNTIINGNRERIRIVSKQSMDIDLWQVQHIQEKVKNTMITLKSVSSMRKETANRDIVKEDQQYKLILAYDYIGTGTAANFHQERVIKEIEQKLPIGYSVKGDNNRTWWGKESKKQYGWLLLIIVIIYFICSVLFESLLLPLAVILMIPVSYIGVFLTFWLFKLNFDQGGFAAMILLSGITVNSALYIINDYNNLKRIRKKHAISAIRLYLKAYNQKIFPIMLTILSTTLGLSPFLTGGTNEVFWPALAAGTIGGLLFSIIGIVFFLPLVLIKKNKIERIKN